MNKYHQGAQNYLNFVNYITFWLFYIDYNVAYQYQGDKCDEHQGYHKANLWTDDFKGCI